MTAQIAKQVYEQWLSKIYTPINPHFSNFPSETKMEIVSIGEKLSINFLYVPEGYVISKLTFENHKTQAIGRLKQFNRVKLLKTWKKDNGD